MSKKLNPEKSAELQAEQRPEQFAHLRGDNAAGFEALDSSVSVMPFLRILQQLSPQLNKKKPEYIPEAAEGLLFNSVTNQLYEPPVEVIVGRFDRYYIEWKPDRGGFVQVHTPGEVGEALARRQLTRDRKNRIVHPETDNVYSETFVYYVLLTEYLTEGVCLLSLSSTQLKEARRWNRQLSNTFLPGTLRRALPYWLRWHLTFPEVSNDEGDWRGLKVDFAGFVTEEQLQLVMEMRKALSAQSRPEFTLLDGNQNAPCLDVSPADLPF